ncbi:hypothetical protein GGTG_09389 [Gaeumannomyces tritici R3-111a-1]|uniref:Uncharacterized protein n=1 Tax=Gaeumannomyces tritici (strain R3-111a-1) TaxID=644352 RepID=J3P793_GAET3|nr:hypothetical protein GGTG_09389 [Gaeumannomyces tritici R3-111a-1]EJT72524.1 hypothetical protein GGTG_09389 [Gaeumannomyces tritici R3-111a-1]
METPNCRNLTNDPEFYQVPACSKVWFSSLDKWSLYRRCNLGLTTEGACKGAPTIDKTWKFPEQKN